MRACVFQRHGRHCKSSQWVFCAYGRCRIKVEAGFDLPISALPPSPSFPPVLLVRSFRCLRHCLRSSQCTPRRTGHFSRLSRVAGGGRIRCKNLWAPPSHRNTASHSLLTLPFNARARGVHSRKGVPHMYADEDFCARTLCWGALWRRPTCMHRGL